MGHTRAKITKVDEDNDFESVKYDDAKSQLDILEKTGTNKESKSDDQYVKKNSDTTDKLLDNPGSPRLPPISRKVDDESDESVIPKFLGVYFLLLMTLTNYFLK